MSAQDQAVLEAVKRAMAAAPGHDRVSARHIAKELPDLSPRTVEHELARLAREGQLTRIQHRGEPIRYRIPRAP
jgi:DNA-binding HxlR family transcriptional regulator